jgi:hypothetical protein
LLFVKAMVVGLKVFLMISLKNIKGSAKKIAGTRREKSTDDERVNVRRRSKTLYWKLW